ncbi:exodeoxyribonuclease VII large subunit [Domibacillus epiphyticus]|uniref:Exodeoxyribonuclease 7 large subunit n=1 Tax=Domibacillus epiphyticus TaxID=1714355 RepID=A0A1V2A9P3_9BACI|nr:exodeoxyribonuclease VII large subunit [Domibacillus epiphyticus]OMP67713.1 exodeoxyribonuclease VII large subunit [Domibacillus epiphyticus]
MEANQCLTVKALTKYIKRKFDADPHLKNVAVKGEISNFKHHSSGHMYFTLKDDSARILAVMFSASNRALKFRPENGMQVVLTGEITVYESSGQYQMYVKTMQPDGVGDLYFAYEQLKKKLEQQGLFQAERKRPLPAYPTCVAVITSPTGAAVRDIITTIKRRYPAVAILIYPALVQGDKAAQSIVSQIQKANTDGRAELLIAGRGGGSIEELWAFNEEAVARAIFDSRIPVISAVGHETDFTIADFVADLRAPTPTAAAEMAVPHIEEVLERLQSKQNRLIRAAAETIRVSRNRHQTAMNSYIIRNPQALYRQQSEKTDRQTEQLIRSVKSILDRKKTAANHTAIQLRRIGPQRRIQVERSQLEQLNRRLRFSAESAVDDKKVRFQNSISMLHALSPLKVMERGYSLTYSENDTLIKSVKDVKKGDQIRVRLADGTLCTDVQLIRGNRDET